MLCLVTRNAEEEITIRESRYGGRSICMDIGVRF